MKISILICTYNRAKYIYNLLESLAKNTFPKSDFEILIVDNNCTDSTRDECQRFAQNHPEIAFRYIVEERQGLSFARNAAIKNAAHEIVIFVDDDATVNADYIATFADFFAQNPNIFAAGGRILPDYETAEPDWMCRYTRALLTAHLDLGDREKPFPRGKFPGGGNSAFRKAVFNQIGDFNTDLGRKGASLASAEEKDIFAKMRQRKMQIFYLPNAILFHKIPQSKLETPYFTRLTLSIGESERLRTLAISKKFYLKRLFSEAFKWCATLILTLFYIVKFSPKKGFKLLIFRKNVTKGLLGIYKSNSL